jgi:dipeptidase
MKKILVFMIAALFLLQEGISCTNLIITKGASSDGSTMLVYTNDGEWLYKLNLSEAADHPDGAFIHFGNDSIKQIAHTNKVIGFQMNEYQVAIGETTFTGREELWDKSKPLKYWHLMKLALERSATAREAIDVITSLVAEYGYGSEGESFSIIDPNEAWILEMIGTGGEGDAQWVAIKIPDGNISAHANMARIGEFPLNDPENCIYSENVISFAVEKGFYIPDSGVPFRFNEAYNPPSPDRLKYCESRVWSLFSRAAPSQNFSSDYCRGVEGAERYPLWIKPDNKLSLQDVMSLVRDHYEGTDFDMTNGIAAGPHGSPFRCRPLFWETDSVKYSWERPISTYNTCFSYIAQARNYLPDDVGGIAWFGVDDTYFTCYVPLYCGITEIPKAFTIGDISKFSWDSMWWVFNFVSNFTNLRYKDMIEDVKQVQNELEDTFISEQKDIEKKIAMIKGSERSVLLTQYSGSAGTLVHSKWIELGELLITKYNDGYIKDANGKPKEAPYSEEWKTSVIKSDPEKYIIPDWNAENSIEELPY